MGILNSHRISWYLIMKNSEQMEELVVIGKGSGREEDVIM
jgi:hypothetical protein